MRSVPLAFSLPSGVTLLTCDVQDQKIIGHKKFKCGKRKEKKDANACVSSWHIIVSLHHLLTIIGRIGLSRSIKMLSLFSSFKMQFTSFSTFSELLQPTVHHDWWWKKNKKTPELISLYSVLLPWPKKSLQPRYSWDWSAVRSCDIEVRFDIDATRGTARRELALADRSRCRMISHDRTADQSHEYLGCNDFFGQGSIWAPAVQHNILSVKQTQNELVTEVLLYISESLNSNVTHVRRFWSWTVPRCCSLRDPLTYWREHKPSM